MLIFATLFPGPGQVAKRVVHHASIAGLHLDRLNPEIFGQLRLHDHAVVGDVPVGRPPRSKRGRLRLIMKKYHRIMTLPSTGEGPSMVSINLNVADYGALLLNPLSDDLGPRMG